MRSNLKNLIFSAVIAALYVILTFVSSAFGLSFGPIQFRISEALIFFSAFSPSAVFGLTLGCLLSNTVSPYGFIDLVFGTLATLFTVLICYFSAKFWKKGAPFLFPVFAAVVNGIFIGIELTFFVPNGGDNIAFLYSALPVAIGELAVGYILGIPLYFLIKQKITKFIYK